MKTNKEKNKEHDGRELLRVRPKQPAYDFKTLEDVIRQWVVGNK
jgi:hypothetical protein